MDAFPQDQCIPSHLGTEFCTGIDFSACVAAGVSLVSRWCLVAANVSLCAVRLGGDGGETEMMQPLLLLCVVWWVFLKGFFFGLVWFYVEMHEYQVCMNL